MEMEGNRLMNRPLVHDTTAWGAHLLDIRCPCVPSILVGEIEAWQNVRFYDSFKVIHRDAQGH